jgi:hypothetical protein
MIYVQAGLYAEGPSDYGFLIPLLDKLLDDLLAQHYPGQVAELPTPLSLDSEASAGPRREDRIADVIERFSDTCQLFVVHADADGDAARARRERVEPGVGKGLARQTDVVAAVACIPIEMTEAWMLVDHEVLKRLGGDVTELSKDPERLRDPKRALEQVLDARRRGRRPNVYEFVGANVSLTALRRLPGFRVFEEELVVALRRVADPMVRSLSES